MLCLSIWNYDLIQKNILQMMVMILLLDFCRKWDHQYILCKFCFTEYLSQCVSLCLYYLFILYHIDFIQNYDYLFHKELCYDNALSCLSLYSLRYIDDQKHKIYDLSTAYNSSDQRCMSRAVNKSEL